MVPCKDSFRLAAKVPSACRSNLVPSADGYVDSGAACSGEPPLENTLYTGPGLVEEIHQPHHNHSGLFENEAAVSGTYFSYLPLVLLSQHPVQCFEANRDGGANEGSLIDGWDSDMTSHLCMNIHTHSPCLLTQYY